MKTKIKVRGATLKSNLRRRPAAEQQAAGNACRQRTGRAGAPSTAAAAAT
jgi:hypothetical protein